MVTENDDASKPKEARPPTLEDLLGLCRKLTTIPPLHLS